MNKYLLGLLNSEMYSACSYAERVLFSCEHIVGPQTSMLARQEAFHIVNNIQHKIIDFLKLRALPPHLALTTVQNETLQQTPGQNPSSWAPPFSQCRQTLEKAKDWLECIGHFPVNQEQYAKMVVDAINQIYSVIHPLHVFCHFEAEIDIAYPRLNILEMADDGLPADDLSFVGEWGQEENQETPDFIHYPKNIQFINFHGKNLKRIRDNDDSPDKQYQETEDNSFSLTEKLNNKQNQNVDIFKEDHFEIPKFILRYETLQELAENNHTVVSSLELQRDKKYHALLSQGHQAMVHKDHKTGLQKFEAALTIKETAECLTFVAWAYSLIDKNDKAKAYCLRAIQKDPDYGPPYNDLGSILLKEGQIQESLKWFDLAKKSTKYQNREYPYINSGRAYLSIKKFYQALDEFNKALILAPQNKELQQMVAKLRQTLELKTSEVNPNSQTF